ncbi:hypothetical protein CONLIGDRAFT_636900 [Coniochaeta ligniaria NRRL 30616]|uniref:SRR1-like domain-containing protein n=1 Tax=Coniochaeta ligniaria NRRL 30616 TaxID=1408157 RepID=A0A1J7J6J4_9PEZI|nr:hypothetical protein CONLIGDRAFT_636900 [Coniochaeta ligniaria NRRL 30616]
MPQLTQKEGEEARVLEPTMLDYGCTPWRRSSQRAADSYDQGIKLWRREDLADIEQQLAQSRTAEKFTVRRTDGTVIHIKNPMFGVLKPIWKPYVKFQEYWHQVRTTPDGPPETYQCTYLVDWTNETVHNYEGPLEGVRLLFENRQKQWNASATCKAFTSQLRQLLSQDVHTKKVTKVVCFGLGELNFKPPDWWRIQNNSKPKDEQEAETSVIEDALTHHAIALTMADVARSCVRTGDTGIVRLLTQDPMYSDETKNMLRELGFEVIGDHGAGGFAELDDESIVFSAFAKAPVKQIIADLARPALIICARSSSASVFSHARKPWGDPESPRTTGLWKRYRSCDFAVLPESVKLEGSLHQLVIHARNGD